MGSKISLSNAEHFTWGDNYDGWFLVKNPDVCIIQEVMLPHTSEIKHYHEKTWQFIYLLSGTLTIEIGNENFELNAQEGIEMPASIPHNFQNKTDQNVSYLLIASPNIPGDRVNL